MMLDGDKAFRKELDTKSAEQEKRHRQALDQALQEHQRVRESAERARQQLEVEIALEQKRREEEEKRKLEESRRRLAEEENARQRRELEDAKRREEERTQQEALKREREEQERKEVAHKQQEEKEKREREASRAREEAERKAKEEAAAKARQDQVQQSKPSPAQSSQQPNGVAPGGQAPAPQVAPSASQQPTSAAEPVNNAPDIVSTVQQREAVHNEYLDVHKRLKLMRKWVAEELKKRDPKLYQRLTDMRIELGKLINQINKIDRKENLEKVSMSYLFMFTLS